MTVVGALEPKIAEFNAKLPTGYTVETGGLYEESGESQRVGVRRRADDDPADARAP